MIKASKKMKVLEKHKEKFTDPKSSYRALAGIHHAEDGTVYATDRHMVLRMLGVHAFKGPVTFDAQTGEIIREEYPVKALEERFQLEWETGFMLSGKENVEEAARILRWVKELYEYYHPLDGVTLFSQYRDVIIHLERPGVRFTVKIADFEDFRKEIRIGFTPRLLYNALRFFEDAGSARIRFSFARDPRAPFLLSDTDNRIDILILPVARRYGS